MPGQPEKPAAAAGMQHRAHGQSSTGRRSDAAGSQEHRALGIAGGPRRHGAASFSTMVKVHATGLQEQVSTQKLPCRRICHPVPQLSVADS